MYPWDEMYKLGKMAYPILVDGKILDRDGTLFDPLTGKRTGDKLPISYQGCGSFCVSTHAVHGMCGTVYDRDAKARIQASDNFMKAACLSGVICADGLLFSGHGNCAGCMEWIGHLTFRSADGASPTQRGPPIACFPAKPQPQAAHVHPLGLDDLPGRQHAVGLLSATVPARPPALDLDPQSSLRLRGRSHAGLETQSTQAICVGDRVFFGTAAGILRCLDRKTGRELWNYPTAGRIISAPTFWEGKLYAGSGDGRVYCLSAADGSLVWRYRVAPVERRIMVFSHLMSAWPVNANVLVEPSTDAGQSGAVAYASAGLIGATGGSLLCAGRQNGKTALGNAFRRSLRHRPLGHRANGLVRGQTLVARRRQRGFHRRSAHRQSRAGDRFRPTRPSSRAPTAISIPTGNREGRISASFPAVGWSWAGGNSICHRAFAVNRGTRPLSSAPGRTACSRAPKGIRS